jgi:hypothetical protein
MTIVEYIPGTGVTEEVHLSLGLILILGEVGLVETYHSRFCFLYFFLLVQKSTPDIVPHRDRRQKTPENDYSPFSSLFPDLAFVLL